jgi:hypothetical protein
MISRQGLTLPSRQDKNAGSLVDHVKQQVSSIRSEHDVRVHRQRHFRGHQRTADAMASGGAAVAIALLQCVHEVAESALYGGCHSKKKTAVATDTPNVNNSTGRSIVSSLVRGRLVG